MSGVKIYTHEFRFFQPPFFFKLFLLYFSLRFLQFFVVSLFFHFLILSCYAWHVFVAVFWLVVCCSHFGGCMYLLYFLLFCRHVFDSFVGLMFCVIFKVFIFGVLFFQVSIFLVVLFFGFLCIVLMLYCSSSFMWFLQVVGYLFSPCFAFVRYQVASWVFC